MECPISWPNTAASWASFAIRMSRPDQTCIIPFGAIEALNHGVCITYTRTSGQCSPASLQATPYTYSFSARSRIRNGLVLNFTSARSICAHSPPSSLATSGRLRRGGGVQLSSAASRPPAVPRPMQPQPRMKCGRRMASVREARQQRLHRLLGGVGIAKITSTLREAVRPYDLAGLQIDERRMRAIYPRAAGRHDHASGERERDHGERLDSLDGLPAATRISVAHDREQGVVSTGLLAQQHRIRAQGPIELPVLPLETLLLAEVMYQDCCADCVMQPVELDDLGIVLQIGRLDAPLLARHVGLADPLAALLRPIGSRRRQPADTQLEQLDVDRHHQDRGAGGQLREPGRELRLAERYCGK